jgi:hypothetical protein
MTPVEVLIHKESLPSFVFYILKFPADIRLKQLVVAGCSV